MNSKEPKTPGIFKFLPILEKIFLIALAIGIILALLEIDFLILKIGLIGFAAILFVSAFRPPVDSASEDEDENEQKGFSELLALIILPKVLWISSAVSTIGIAFYFITPENKGYREMLLIGMLTIVVGLVLFALFLVSGTKYLKTVVSVLYRAVPALLAAIYFFFK